MASRATLGRSLGLLRSFPLEQSDPDAFYTGLARDTVELVADLWAESGDRTARLMSTKPRRASALSGWRRSTSV